MSRDSQARGWMITLPEEHYPREKVEELLAKDSYSYVGQLEEGGKTAYRHWQIFLQTKSPTRFSTLKNLLAKAHIEQRRGTITQAVEYVTKEDSRVEGEPPLEWGEIRGLSQGKRSDLDELRELALDSNMSYDELLSEVPAASRHHQMTRELLGVRARREHGRQLRDVQVTWLWGAPGIGKTRALYDAYNPADFFRVTDYKNPFDAYSGEPILVLDEYRGQFPPALMLNLLDRYPLELPARYSNHQAQFTQVIIISNFPPQECTEGWRERSKAALMRRLHRVIHQTEEYPGSDESD